MITEAEHHRLSRGSADGSSSGSPRDPPSLALDSNDFVNKVAKFEMISRGKPTSTSTSPTAKSPPPPPTATTTTGGAAAAGGVKYPGLPTSPGYVGEKVFSRDTATTRVPAAVLQGGVGGGERVISTCSSLSSSSLTSVSTLNCSSDSSGSNRSLTSPPVTPHGSWQPPTPTSTPSSHPHPHTQGPVFVTLGDRRLDGRGEPAPVVIRPAPEGVKASGRGAVVNGDSVTSPPRRSSGGVPLRDSGSCSSKDDSGSEKWHRDTFEGMDFDLSQMSESEQELARRHREIVAERKREQEQERLERQRLEEILRMCAEYQQEVETPTPSPSYSSSSSASSSSASAQGTRSARGYAGSGGSKSSISTSTSTSSKGKRAVAPPGFLDLTRPSPEAADHQDRSRGPADSSSSSSSSSKPSELSLNPPPPTSGSSSSSNGGGGSSGGDGDRKVSGEFRPNVTKIKTNGSLMLSSPSNPHKEGLFSFQMRRCESNSSTSEDEMLAGNSEDTGTIKRRPPQQPSLPEEGRPGAGPGTGGHGSAGQEAAVASSAHVSLQPDKSSSSVPCGSTTGGGGGGPSGSSVPSRPCVVPGSNYTAASVHHHQQQHGGVGVSSSSSSTTSLSRPSVFTSGQNHSGDAHAPSPAASTSSSSPSKESCFSPSKESSFTSPGQSRIDEILNSSFEAEREAAELGSYGKFSVHINAQISCDVSAPPDDVDDNDNDKDEEDDLELAGGYRSKGSHSSTSSSKGSRSSVSSSNTVQENVMEVKEDTPTPVNSDSEPAEGEAFRAEGGAGAFRAEGSSSGSFSVLANGVVAGITPAAAGATATAVATSSSSGVLRNREVSCGVGFVVCVCWLCGCVGVSCVCVC